MICKTYHSSPLGLVEEENITSGTALIRCALVLTLLVGTVLSFWASVTSEQMELPGVKSEIRVEEYSGAGIAPDAVLRDLSGLAEKRGGAVYVEFPSPTGRAVYAAGSNIDDWIQHGYRGLPGSPEITVHKLTELPHTEYRQVFELKGDQSFRDSFEGYLQNQAIPHEELVSQQWAFLLSGTALGSLAQLLLGFCFALCAIGIILNSRTDAVRRLHGYGLAASCWHELRRAHHRSIAVLAILILAINAGMAWWSNVDSALQWLVYLGVFIGTGLLVCLVSIIASLLLLRAANIIALLGGRLPGNAVLPGVYLVRLVALIAVSTMCIGSINYSTEWFKQRDEAEQWKSTPEMYALSLNGARSLEDTRDTTSVLAQKLRKLSSQQRLLLAQFYDEGILRDGGMDRDMMVYNSSAARESLTGPALEAYEQALKDNRPVWLKPDNLSSNTDTKQLRRAVGSVDSWNEVTYPSGTTTAKTWEVGVDEWMNRSSTKDPLIAVLPDDDLPLDDRNLVAALSQKKAMLTDYGDFQKLQQDPAVGSFIRSATPLPQEWAAHHQTMGRTVWVYLGGFVAAVLLSVISAVATLFACLRIYHQRLRASFVHGVIPYKLVTILVAAESAVFIFLARHLWNKGEPVRQWSEGGELAGAADPSLIAMLSVPTAAWLVTLLLAVATSIPVTMLWLRKYSKGQLIESKR